MLDIVNLPSVNPTHDIIVGATSVAVTVPTAGAASVDSHIDAINILIPQLKQITDRLEAEIGEHILAIKAAAPNEWEGIVKTRCGLSRSRAFELMRIADGTKSAEQTRRETNARQIRHRQSQAIRDLTDSKITELKAAHRRELADARTEISEREEAHERQIARFEHEIAELSDARNLGSERDQLRKALSEIVELLAEMRGLMTHAERNRTAVITKITRAETIATSALQPAKVVVVNLPAKQAA
jgi:hypothetical protein